MLLRAPQTYLSLLEHALDRAGVPAWYHRGTQRPDPSGRALLALVACAEEGLSARRFALQMTVDERVHDKFQYAKALLGHAVPPGDLAEVFERVLDLALAELEKRTFAATTRPGRQRSSEDPRHIPAHVKRAVWERDGGQCTFTSEAGQRCAARTRLEFDHVHPAEARKAAAAAPVRAA